VGRRDAEPAPDDRRAVSEHSCLFEDRWQRLLRSLYPIGGVVYDGPRAEQTARMVRDFHRTVSPTAAATMRATPRPSPGRTRHPS
jgi:uncharacterized protein (DUF2236 family)